MKRACGLAAALAVLAASVAAAQVGSGKKRRPLPHEYGRVVLDNHSSAAGLAPVAFEHWLHRAKFTCRLCHVDLGFAMKAGATDVKAADNAAGFFCGACHDGKRVIESVKVFESCGKQQPHEQRAACQRCHSVGKDVKPRYDFASFTKSLPRGRFGNGVDWEKAEEAGLVKPVDFLPGVSIPRTALTAQKDFALSPKLAGMPEIIFSHKKHTVWSGCEGCHPEIFVGVKKGATKYSMVEIFEGKYCGACHASVAFPLIDCQRCHAKPVQPASQVTAP
jgi:c(7)-type cytochrome triheme protein